MNCYRLVFCRWLLTGFLKIAISNVLTNLDYAIPEAYVFHNGNVSTAGKVAYLPIYMLMLVEKEKSAAEMIYRIDLSMLQEDR